MNMFLNENWGELVRDLEPAIGETASEMLNGILTNMSELLPFDEVFPETV